MTQIKSIPDGITGFKALTYLGLIVKGLAFEDLLKLKSLPNLRTLVLDVDFESKEEELEKIFSNVDIRFRDADYF